MLSARDEPAPSSSPPPEHLDAGLVEPAPAMPAVASQAATARRRPARADRMRQRIRSALAGVALAALTVGAALAEGNVYTVQPGDNLKDVAARLGVPTSDLVLANSLGDPDLLQVGQTLVLPSGAAVERAQPATRGNRVEREVLGRNFQWPLQGPITTYYGEAGPLWRTGYHPGLDIGAPIGSPIRAIADGVVIEAESDGYNRGYGHYVKVDHGGGLHSLYAHMSVVSTREGDRVGAGSVLGQVGMTGVTTGPHLHLEVRQDGATRDPLKYIN
jgi:murein DD-endopeptidase MepM/ murein hydrolase activator NlpD